MWARQNGLAKGYTKVPQWPHHQCLNHVPLNLVFEETDITVLVLYVLLSKQEGPGTLTIKTHQSQRVIIIYEL